MKFQGKVMKKILLSVMLVALFDATDAQMPVEQNIMLQIQQAEKLIKDNPTAATAAFDEILKGKNKKNPGILVEIGEAYLKAGNVDEAAKYAAKAKEADNKSAIAYLLSGDIYLAKDDASKASSEYNQAIYFDENCSDAYLKYANVYKGVNPQLSIEMLEKLKNKKPDDTRIEKMMGDIYYSMGKYKSAAEKYDTYMTNGTPSETDFARYATLLYLNKNYEKSKSIADRGLSVNPDNHVMKRLAMYNDDELKKYSEGLEIANKFFTNANDSDLVYLDYVYYGRLLASTNKYDEALTQYQKAITMDEQHPDLYKEMSGIYEKKRDFSNAISYYKKYIDGLEGKEDPSELFSYGRLNYYAASDSTDKAKQQLYLDEADNIFSKVAEKVPDNYLGSFWRARVNSLKDPETSQGLAKPYYEAALAILEKNPNSATSFKSQIIECNSYLGYYYYVKGDNAQSKLYWNKILEIDPQNKTAFKALEGIK